MEYITFKPKNSDTFFGHTTVVQKVSKGPVLLMWIEDIMFKNQILEVEIPDENMQCSYLYLNTVLDSTAMSH